ncbi:MAG: SRPBCC family protein [Cytophagales bacterium]|nr:SRPBCC family protein [Cytophagales bacterium]
MMKKKVKVLIGIGVVLFVVMIVAFTPSAMERHVNRRTFAASKADVWAVISDVANYHQYATGLTGVTILSGEGKGMIRSCSDELGSWKETCTAWNEGTSYSFNVHTGKDYPYPFKTFRGTWSINDLHLDQAELVIEFEYQFPYRWMSWLFSGATHKAIDEGNNTLIKNWERAILQKASLISQTDE